MYPFLAFYALISRLCTRKPPLCRVLFMHGFDIYFCIMDLYDAIHEMRRLSAANKPFSFTFMSCNMTKGKSDGIISVRKGRLLKRPDSKFHENAEFVERYLDLDTMQSRFFYQVLLMTFNGETVILR